jgi:hypothetical protein
MTALIREKQPLKLIVNDFFLHPDKLVGDKGEILGILVTPHVFGFFSRQIMPLLTRYLATPAGRTHGCIDKN